MKKQKKVEKKYFLGYKLQRKSTFESKVLWAMFKKIWTLFKNLRDVQKLHVWITMASLKKLSHGPLGIQPDWQLIVIQPEETEDICTRKYKTSWSVHNSTLTQLRAEAGTSNVFWNGYEIYVAPHI